MTELDAALKLRLVDEVTAKARSIADQFGIVGAEALASGEVAGQAFEELKVRELGAREEARRLGAQLRRLKASGEGTEQEVRELSVQLVRAREEARKLGRAARDVSRAHQQMGRSTGRASDRIARSSRAQARASTEAAGATRASAGAMEFVSKSSKNTGREMGGLVNVVAELSYSMGTAVPGMQGVGMQMAMMGGSAYQLGAAFGPIGVGIGVITGLAPTLISSLMSMREETDAAADANERLNRTFLERIDHMRELDEAQEREAALAAGREDVAEQDRALRAVRQTLRERQGDRRSALSGLSDMERGVVEQVLAEGPGEGETEGQAIARRLFEARRQRAEERGQTFNEGLVQRQTNIRSGELVSNLGQARAAQESVGQAEREVRAAEQALQRARSRVQSEEQFQATQRAPEEAQQRLSDLLTSSGLSEQQRSRVEQQLERGRLSEQARRQLGGRADSVLAAQRQVAESERAAAAARLERNDTFADRSNAEPASEPEEPIERARRRIRRAEPTPAPAPEQPTADLMQFARDMDRVRESWNETRLRVTVEDGRVTTRAEGAVDTPIEVDTVSSGLTGGQQ